MNIAVVMQFAIATLLPVAACVVLMLLREHTSLSRIPKMGWHVVVGVVFGGIAIYGTEAGIPVEGAMMNVRDAAPLIAGLFFSGPAGIIAGVIGGVERWIAVMWGVGSYTRLACTLGTIIAGVYAAVLRKYLFDNRMPSWPMSLATGMVAEVIHLLLVFLTNFDTAARAFGVVQMCALPMISCVGISAGLAALAVARLNNQPIVVPRMERGVAQIVQSRLLIGILAAFLVSIGFTGVLQSRLSETDTASLLQLNLEDVESDIQDASDANLLELTRRAAMDLYIPSTVSNEDCNRVAAELQVAEVNVVNDKGIIVASTVPEFVGFDMASGEQSAEFLVLLPGGGKIQYVQSYQPIAYDASTSRKYAGVAVSGGFVQVGYDAEHFVDDLSTQIASAVKYRHVGQGGEIVVIDEKGRVISTRGDASGRTAEKLSADASSVDAGEVFSTEFADTEYYASYDEVEGYRIIAMLPASEADFARDVSVLIMSFMEVLVFAALFLIIYFAIKRVVVRSIWQVNGRLNEITKGDLDVQVDVRETSEFASLSDDINKTVGALKDSIALVQADLDMAADIQANSLPDITPAMAARTEFELSASMEPAKEVGGDFYDFFMIDDDHLGLVAADVSGKGIPAALFMMQSKTVIKMEALSGIAPDEVLLRANADLSEKNDNDMFTTAWLGVLEISTGKLTYADAGHEKLAIYHDGTWDLPPKPNRAVALASWDQEDYELLDENFQFRNHTMVLHPGDAIMQYTDGVTEATDADDELFGDERLLQALNDAPDTTPGSFLPFVRERISEFVKDAPQFDDITMLGLLYRGAEESPGKGEGDNTRA